MRQRDFQRDEPTDDQLAKLDAWWAAWQAANEPTQQMAAHSSARTTKLYDRRNDQLTLDEIERIDI